ncbi:bifunctional glutamate--cysteine ligase GshA/glutathione synthetase GshB [Gemella sp. zg-1178]|uniref:bifunctional glutamate--cysteine ligase GshA/glutathione synthetase GshB n=1 Tax=Gemella sp. zg-1178 TaxID=2840372 RepID=UPI001C05893D|nr:bifunctional glutamate--cysteine ligase GshA/glutathione synthetase GshB [Gemella sp. zg-1178]MBU0278620.1 bifunctional glutamate--cysteine ligase GshA/glutathione synthetase GshB [Gemella sp. zg-1178]
MNFKEIIKEQDLFALFNEATIGIEKEGQRVLKNAEIAKTPHPKNIGNRQNHPYIQTDFAESQVELITSPEENSREVYRYLSAIHEVLLRKLPQDEFIWPLSIPAILPKEEDIQVAQFDKKEDVEYREYLVSVYGKYIQMISGIHYNFGFSQDFINRLVEITKLEENILRNKLYMKLARQFIRYQWLLVYFYGASPLAPDEFFTKLKNPKKIVRSLRTSKYGYVNDESIKVSFASIEEYAKTLTGFVAEGKLIAEKEFYSSVRFRGAGKVLDLQKKGIQYLEFRLFDINPFAPYGIKEEDIRFIQLFAMLLLWLDEEDEKTSVEIGKNYSEQIALDNPLKSPIFLKEAEYLLNNLLEIIENANFSLEDKKLVENKIKEIYNPKLTVGGKLWLEYEKVGSMADLGSKLAIEYKNQALEKYYSLTAFSNMELSTQALMSDAIAQGISIKILDEQDQFLKLSYGKHTEYVKNGNMTKYDTYISPLIMENKVVTKKILAENNFRVPKSYQYNSIDKAKSEFEKIRGKAIVIKPKSTNFGLGITIFKNGINNLDDYEKALSIALKEDKEIMVEEFIEGTEYRFFVLGDKTLAVLLRVPANVIGNGKSTIAELVAKKNENSLRGDGLSSPLKKIQLGDIELLQLKEQGLNATSILAEGKIAYLRANSNISTGGDSIDMTDRVDESYKNLAVGITQAMGAKICGVDLIIEDIETVATNKNYGVIEANFNPMMMMHIFPAEGKSHRLTEEVLKILFPEKY